MVSCDRLTSFSRSQDSHPAFASFARLLLPWDGRRYDEEMRLSDIGSLLPYHRHVVAETVVGALNRMIDDVNNGHAVFYAFYSEEQMRELPARENTGLFFFRGKPGAPFAVVSPGGGFSYVGSVHEGFPSATEISARGYNAFVLRYRAGYGGAVATEDLAVAISYTFRNAQALGVGTRDYSLSEPPTFIVVGEQDGFAPPSAMEGRIAALRGAGVEVGFQKYKNLGHGFGSGTGTSAEGWIADAVRFRENFITQRNRCTRRPAAPSGQEAL